MEPIDFFTLYRILCVAFIINV